jgi:hypothetical protein
MSSLYVITKPGKDVSAEKESLSSTPPNGVSLTYEDIADEALHDLRGAVIKNVGGRREPVIDPAVRKIFDDIKGHKLKYRQHERVLQGVKKYSIEGIALVLHVSRQVVQENITLQISIQKDGQTEVRGSVAQYNIWVKELTKPGDSQRKIHNAKIAARKLEGMLRMSTMEEFWLTPKGVPSNCPFTVEDFMDHMAMTGSFNAAVREEYKRNKDYFKY